MGGMDQALETQHAWLKEDTNRVLVEEVGDESVERDGQVLVCLGRCLHPADKPLHGGRSRHQAQTGHDCTPE